MHSKVGVAEKNLIGTLDSRLYPLIWAEHFRQSNSQWLEFADALLPDNFPLLQAEAADFHANLWDIVLKISAVEQQAVGNLQDAVV